jgi:hypothetical protein
MEPETLEPTLVAHPNLAILNFSFWEIGSFKALLRLLLR